MLGYFCAPQPRYHEPIAGLNEPGKSAAHDSHSLQDALITSLSSAEKIR